MTVSENRQGIVLLPSHLPLLPSFPRSDGQLISDRVMGITTVLQKMGGQAGEQLNEDKCPTQDSHWRCCWEVKSRPTDREGTWRWHL